MENHGVEGEERMEERKSEWSEEGGAERPMTAAGQAHGRPSPPLRFG